MKKSLTYFLALFLLVGMCSCKQEKHTPLKALSPKATNGDEYLYEITYDDYDFDSALKYVVDNQEKLLKKEPAACSAVRNGNFYGRNLDYFINQDADVVIHTKATKDHFASLGMASCCPIISKPTIDAGKFDETLYNLLPLFTVDGINENGVAANINVLPTKQCKPTTGTNPGAPTLLVSCVVRYILDHAKSVDHAIELLKERNIVSLPAEAFPFETHFMISDANKTVVVEFWNNEMVVVNSNIMTNFYLCNDKCVERMGVERFDILKEHYEEGATAEGMKKLMQRVWYSQTYTRDTKPFWYSEFVSEELTNPDLEAGNVAPFDEVVDRAIAKFGSMEQQKKNRLNDSWYTTHTSIYDLKNLTLTLIAQENDTEWHFSLKDK